MTKKSDISSLPPDTVTEPEPKPVPLIRLKTPDGKADEDRPPVAPVAGAEPVPRTLHQNERAPAGLTRYKIVCRGYGECGGFAPRYILAANEQQAREHYLYVTGLAGMVARMGKDAPDPELVVRRQPD